MDSAWIWLIAGVVLAIAELIVPGVFLIWLGAAALITGAIGLLASLPATVEFAVFTLTAAIAVVTGRTVMARLPILSDDPLLNERTARLVGRRVTVVEPLVGGEGRVRVGDSIWSASGPDAPVGAVMEVVGADGGHLIVAPIEPREPTAVEPRG